MKRGAPFLLLTALACAPTAPERPVPAGWVEVSRFLDSVVADGVAPGAVLGVSRNGCHYYHGTGRLGRDDPTRPDSTSIYDLASLTKVVALTTVVMLGVERGLLDLDAPVSRYVPEFLAGAPASRGAVTLRHLLTHSSGLPAGRPLYREAASRVEALALLDGTGLAAAPGDSFVYSDLGAMLLTQAAERAHGARIDTLVDREIVRPLRLQDTRYLPPRGWLGRIAPTEQDPWRGRMLRGEVHDENASRLDGVSGHAGLFGSTRDLLRFGDWLLGGLPGGSPVSAGCRAHLPPAPTPVAQFIRRQDLPAGSSRALGWDTPSGQSSGGSLISRTSFGHTGFTGTSIWVDPERRLVIVLLANRVHPSRANARFGPVRGQVADRVVRSLGPERLSP